MSRQIRAPRQENRDVTVYIQVNFVWYTARATGTRARFRVANNENSDGSVNFDSFFQSVSPLSLHFLCVCWLTAKYMCAYFLNDRVYGLYSTSAAVAAAAAAAAQHHIFREKVSR